MSLPRLRAPTEHGQILAVPALACAGELLERNELSRQNSRIVSGDLSHADWRNLARREILSISAKYHLAAGESVPTQPDGPWFVAGHQPELFHPGVWFKNFALHDLAKRFRASSLNLVIDTDTAKSALLHVPAGERLGRLPFDRSVPETPFEERLVDDESLFASLPERFREHSAAWDFEPMLPEFWRDMTSSPMHTRLLGERFARARRRVEHRWGVAQPEAPMSRVCQTEAFARFALAIISRLPEFHTSYNEIVRAHRREHGIRSKNHPVPDLARDGDWLETPFWAWPAGASRRGRLFVREARDTWDLRVAGIEGPRVQRNDGVAGWRELEAGEFKVRSRALTTTMFLRLFVADLFLHGIGGGIYDALTDRIIARFFGTTPPTYLVLSATLLLPLPRFPGAQDQARIIQRHVRELKYQPERSLTETESARTWIAEKRDWIARVGVTHAERAKRYHEIRRLNTAMQPFLGQQSANLATAMQVAEHQVRRHAVAMRRDWAFCLYPEAMLRAFFLRTS